MANKITINGKEYNIPKIDFKAIVEMEKLGADFTQFQTFGLILSAVAYTIKGTTESASEEIEKHISNGGTINDFMPLIKAVTDSSFFQNLAKTVRK